MKNISKRYGVLQWVHGLVTVVMNGWLTEFRDRPAASMGPRSGNRGYDGGVLIEDPAIAGLQWVHGLVTVVMFRLETVTLDCLSASMGPRSGNRGYEL